MHKAVIVDDELHCSKTLELLLRNHCPSVEIAASFNDPLQALDYLSNHPADIVFLDIDMPGMSGFELLDRIENPLFQLVFTTAYDQFAIKAFKYNAWDYLLKPIDEEELVRCVEKLTIKKESVNKEKLQQLVESYLSSNIQAATRIALPTLEGWELVNTHEIDRCESVSNYTRIFLTGDQRQLLVCRTLKEISLLLSGNFVRVHQSHLVNRLQVRKLIKGDGGFLVMQDGTEIPVSRSRKQAIFQALIQ